ncbi:hypothetical protein GCM10010910_07700 [Microbacterium nanhaiense]|uniref:Uncharacterized protein n=1 Tax=Microbacterium nanhaiense TaxID=1301026 RepID=A0ABQ2MXL7_9MICO|nr:hypothetical protein GCM10010910_07700 [Microbacterium nanhaiense]
MDIVTPSPPLSRCQNWSSGRDEFAKIDPLPGAHDARKAVAAAMPPSARNCRREAENGGEDMGHSLVTIEQKSPDYIDVTAGADSSSQAGRGRARGDC